MIKFDIKNNYVQAVTFREMASNPDILSILNDLVKMTLLMQLWSTGDQINIIMIEFKIKK
jgi:hypothetical protein